MKTSTGQCGRCNGDAYHDGERWRHSATHLPLDHCPTVVGPEVAVEGEINAMASIVEAFTGMDEAARQRILRWANDRWGSVREMEQQQ